MSSSYENCPQCILLATHCACCGRPLVDARSVERGIGPECWRRHGYDDLEELGDAQRVLCNKLTYAAACYAQQGRISEVRRCADAVRALGLEKLAGLIVARFRNAERQVKITVLCQGGRLYWSAPFRRGGRHAFVADMRALPTRRWHGDIEKNSVAPEQRVALWEFFKKWYPGVYGRGPDEAIWKVPSGQGSEDKSEEETPGQVSQSELPISQEEASFSQLEVMV